MMDFNAYMLVIASVVNNLVTLSSQSQQSRVAGLLTTANLFIVIVQVPVTQSSRTLQARQIKTHSCPHRVQWPRYVYKN